MTSVLGGIAVFALIAVYGAQIVAQDSRPARGLATTDNYAAAAKKVAVPFEKQAA